MPRESNLRSVPEWAGRITALRNNLKISQGELARKLECSPMTVSRWERGLLVPSGEYFIRLGKLAGNREAWSFWEHTGLQLADVMRALPKAARSKNVLPTHASLERAHAGPGAMSPKADCVVIALPILRANVGSHGKPGAKLLSLDHAPAIGLMSAPADWCPNPRYTSMVRVKGDSMEPLICDGNILAIDSFQTERSALHGKIVVATSENNGLCVSRMRCFDKLEVLESENRSYPPIVLGNKSGWRVLGKVLWWITAAP
jgi:SOS-response transcriptional repressor LexA